MNLRGVLMSWAGRDGGKDLDVGQLNAGASNHLNLDEMAMRQEEGLWVWDMSGMTWDGG